MPWPRTDTDVADFRWFVDERNRRKYPRHVHLWEQYSICGCGSLLEEGEVDDGVCEMCLLSGLRSPRRNLTEMEVEQYHASLDRIFDALDWFQSSGSVNPLTCGSCGAFMKGEFVRAKGVVLVCGACGTHQEEWPWRAVCEAYEAADI